MADLKLNGPQYLVALGRARQSGHAEAACSVNQPPLCELLVKHLGVGRAA